MKKNKHKKKNKLIDANKPVKENKQLLVNMVTSLIIFGINICIGFLFTPYVVKTVGSEAFGFVSLANNMINYATIITVALNSVAGRFITIKVHQGEELEANQYFSSVLISNVIFSAFIVIIGIPFIWCLEHIIHIPLQLIPSVKLLFIFIIANFIISILSTVFTVATFITNKLYLGNIINCIASLLKILLLFGLFGFISPNVAFIGLVACICSIVTVIANILFTRKLVPSLKVKIEFFSFKLMIQLLGSGIWNTVTRIAQILSDGLDLLICNLWVSTLAMGQLSIGKVIPGFMSTLISSVAGVFSPELTRYYAKGDTESLVKELKLSMKMTSFFSNIPFCIIVVFGDWFFGLWMPTQDKNTLYILTVLTMQAVVVSGAITGLNNVFLITNHLKVNALFWISISFFDVFVVVILLKTTGLGAFAVAGVSTLVGIFANITFVPIYACKCLNIKWNTFYPQIFRYTGTTILMLLIFLLSKKIIHFDNTWFAFFIVVIISIIVGGATNFAILLNSFERKYLLSRIKERILRR